MKVLYFSKLPRPLRNRAFSLTAMVLGVCALSAGPAAAATLTASTPVEISGYCSGQNAETIQASDPAAHAVYETWMGCKGIAVSRSMDDGKTWSNPYTLQGSSGQSGQRAWDPAITLAPDGTVYASFMVARSGLTYPVIDSSKDHGITFSTAGAAVPPGTTGSNWGDRDFLTVGPSGTLYLTWDYGPSAASVQQTCPASGSCTFTAGDLNAVIQKSTDGGTTWSSITPISPNYPNSGADSAPILAEPDGTLDVVYQGYDVTNIPADNLGAAYTYSTRSTDGGQTWSAPVKIGGNAGSMNALEWWIDGAEALGPDGTLYATWDTQASNTDTGWLAYSTDHGATWSAPVQAPADTLNVPHIMQVVAGPPGIAYVGWLSNSDSRGYALYLRAFSTTGGWLTSPIQVSQAFGTASIWPGDTFGFSAQSPTQLVMAWGSAVAPSSSSEISATTITATTP